MWVPIARGVWLIAAGLLVFAAADAVLVGVRLSTGLRAAGAVVAVRSETRHVRHSDELGDTSSSIELHAATVRFTDEDGIAHSVETAPVPRDFRTGETIPVVYHRDAPHAAMVLVHDLPWDRPLSVAGVAAIVGMFGLLAYTLGRARGEGR